MINQILNERIMKTINERIMKIINLNRKTMLVLTSISLVYIILINQFVFMPPVGRHAWNEAIYLTFLHTIVDNNNPFLLYQAYDIARPDYNVGYTYFLTSYIFFDFFKIMHLDISEMIIFRLLSIFSTLMSLAIIFFIMKEFDIRNNTIYTVLILYLFSPLVMNFGWKAQIEPFLILLFLISQLLFIKFLKYRNQTNLYISCLIFGTIIASRSNFIVFTPIYVVPFLLSKDLKRMISVPFLTIFAIFITIAPSLILYPQYGQLGFLYKRIFDAGAYATFAGKPIDNVISTFIDDALWKQALLLFPLTILSLLFFKKVVQIRLRSYFTLLFLTSWSFLLYTHIHTANHIYQMYYAILLMILAGGISIDTLSNKLKRYSSYFLYSLILISAILSYNYATSFYGLYTARIYNGDIDAYGTFESYDVGVAMRQILNETKSDGYILVQSPTVYYPAYHQSITYFGDFKWNSEKRNYTSYSFFEDQNAFIDDIKTRNIDMLTITPDVYGNKIQKFDDYINSNFVDICNTKNFAIFLNKTIFDNNISIKSRCNDFLNKEKNGV